MSNFSFFEERFPALADFENLAEQYCYKRIRFMSGVFLLAVLFFTAPVYANKL